jgi:eukaryotic-like serine/threonine-protein kinase
VVELASSGRSLSVGEQVGEYKILSVLGMGGMGVVYKALDLKLQRTVALKFLPHDLRLEQRDKDRLLHEARAASGLDHTNIGVIHDLEETPGGQVFIVMAYYQGLTLAAKISRGPLPPSEALDIMKQLARGLSQAHAQGILHRDIKPSNVIMTSQGVAKIVDFGLARLTGQAASTLTAGIAGTLAYMSPEQARGEPLDARSDIWSLGVVFAEMLTGQNPFQRENMSAVLMAILDQPPGSLETVPPQLAPVLFRCLAKDTARRYASCQELLDDLERLSPAEAAKPSASFPKSREFKRYLEDASASRQSLQVAIKRERKGWISLLAVLLLTALLFGIPAVRERMASLLFGRVERHIAVLPFDNVGNNPADEEVSRGLMDSLTSGLSNLDVTNQALWVVPSSVVRARNVQDPSAALRELGANLVVKGSIQRDGQDIRLTLNLIDTQHVRQIGSIPLEDPAGDLAALQDQAVSRLARLMNINVTSAMLHAGAGIAPAAYESYLKALGYIQRYDKAGNLDLAIAALQSAVQTDRRFALGYAELGEAYRIKNQLDPNPRWIDQVSANCERAVQLDDHLPATYVTLGRLHSSQGKNELALDEFQKALQVNPRNADAIMGVASVYEHMGRTGDAEASYKQAAALRPDYWDGYNSLGWFYYRQGRTGDAVVQFRRVVELTPDNAAGYSNLAAALVDLGDPKALSEAEAALTKSIQLGPNYPAYANLGNLYFSQKRYAEAVQMTRKALELNDKDWAVWDNLLMSYEWLHDEQNTRSVREKTLAMLQSYVSGHSQDVQAESRLSSLEAESGQRENSLRHAEAALALAPKDPAVLADLAVTYEELGDRAEALKYVQQSLGNGYTFAGLQSRPGLQKLLADPHFSPSATK